MTEKRKRGRPKTEAGPRTERLMVRMHPAELEAAQQRAHNLGLSIAELVRRLLARGKINV